MSCSSTRPILRKMLRVVLGWVILMQVSQVQPFNLDLRFPHVYLSDNPGDYFGFNVALHPGSSKRGENPSWMLVGAPRRNRSDAPHAVNPGDVLRCEFSRPCQPLYMDQGSRSDGMENLDGSMLGAAQDILGGRYVTSASRWKDARNLSDSYYMLGKVFWGDATDVTSQIETFVPLDNEAKFSKRFDTIYKKNELFYLYAHGLAGFSVHFPSIFKGQKELLLGAPGAFNSVGTAILYRDSTDFASGRERRRRKRGISPVAFADQPIIGDTFLQYSMHVSQPWKWLQAFGYFGYAVTSGRFGSKSKMLYVGGAPRANSTGAVSIFTFPRDSNSPLDIIMHLTPEKSPQIGQYFGSALASGDLNGDGLDDLLVGAPLFSLTQEEGRVYVYLGSIRHTITPALQNRVLEGKTPNGRFGTAISCVGDLDMDGYADFAIGAPYEGAGVVYIYRGSKNGLPERPSQVIEGTSFASHVSGFGISISRGQDVDENGYNDVAIGAHRTGHAVLLRTRPVVHLDVELSPLELPNGLLTRDAKEMKIELCVKYSGHELPQVLQLERVLELDSKLQRLTYEGQHTHQSRVQLKARTDHPDGFNCEDLRFNLKRNIRNFLEPLSIRVYYKPRLDYENLLHAPLIFVGENIARESANTDSFCGECPLLNPDKDMSSQISVSFVTECGNDNVCRSNLASRVEFLASPVQYEGQEGYILGSSSSVRVRVTVWNQEGADPAYMTRLALVLPTRAARLPPNCREVEGHNITCEVANPLQGGHQNQRVVDLELDTSDLTTHLGHLEVTAHALTQSMDEDPSDDESTASILLVAEADITISGKPKEDQYFFNSENEDEQKESEMSQKQIPFSFIYEIEKFGVSPVSEIHFVIRFPVGFKSGSNFISIPTISRVLRNGQQEANACTLAETSHDLPADTNKIARIQRTRRETTNELTPAVSSTPVNRTLFINCSQEYLTCRELRCKVGPFLDASTLVTLETELKLDITLLEPLLNKRDIIAYSTEAQITGMDKNVRQPTRQRPDRAVVSATFLSSPVSSGVPWWAIVLAVLGGLLLLVAIVTALVKAGFFVRKDKDNLEQLRTEKKMQQRGTINSAVQEPDD